MSHRFRKDSRKCTVHPQDSPKEAGCISSPQVRGTRVPVRRFESRLRFIPADAGNVTTTLVLVPSTPVHPRGCGEHSLPQWKRASRSGSSPRLWGMQLIISKHKIPSYSSAEFFSCQGPGPRFQLQCRSRNHRSMPALAMAGWWGASAWSHTE